jgi:hypothetical protein
MVIQKFDLLKLTCAKLSFVPEKVNFYEKKFGKILDKKKVALNRFLLFGIEVYFA